jgi:CHAD domain-containing protein
LDMGNRHKLVQDQHISQGPGAAGGKTRQSIQPAKHKPAKASAKQDTNATSTELSIQHLFELAGGFNAAIDKCMLGAEVETVHRVRTVSRRVQAMVEVVLRETGTRGKAFEKPANAWLRSIKNIRRAAGPVRDLDVHRKLLEKAVYRWTKKAAPVEDANPETDVSRREAGESIGAPGKPGVGLPGWMSQLSSQAKRIDDWLRDDRHARAEILRKEIKKKREKLEDRQAQFQLAVQRAPVVRLKRPRSPGILALDSFVRVVDAIPSLDAANLHDFRKRIKRARYVAESGEGELSKRIGVALKRIQDAIGDWHDWQSLTAEARAALKDGETELTAWLDSQAENFLTAAMRTTEQVRGQLLGEWMAAKSERRAVAAESVPRKPPAGAALLVSPATRHGRTPGISNLA